MENNKPFDESLSDLEKDFDKISIAPIEPEAKPSKAAMLIELMKNAELFCDDTGEPHATFENNGHLETWRINSETFGNLLSAMYWGRHQKAPSKNSLQDALAIISGKARFGGGQRQKVYMRVAKKESVIYIDPVTESWDVIAINSSGWSVVKNAPVKFVRTENMQALPLPQKGGDINRLWQFINVPERSKKLMLAFILECFRIDTPFVILLLYGLKGSGKSTDQEIIKLLIDPSSSNLRCPPKNSDDLLVSASNNYLVSFNNVSHLSNTQQDELCCISTGGGLGRRQLYTTNQEFVVDIRRPVIMNGLDNFITAQDLIDRCIIVELPAITNNIRKTEEEIFTAFKQEYSSLFGAVLDILALTLRELPNAQLESKPRMADFAMLGTALEKALNWGSGSFMEDYENNRKENILSAMEHSPVILAVMKLMKLQQRYEGTYADLYSVLGNYKPNTGGWPQSPKGLANQIKNHIHALKLVGINVEFTERREDGYHVWLYK